MKLNPDCVRDVLLSVEANTNYDKMWEFNPYNIQVNALKKYSGEEIVYHVSQCDKANLIDGCRILELGKYVIISDLSPQGHEFIANTTPEPVWSKIKSKGISSLYVIFNLARDFALAYYQGTLQ